MLISRRAGGFTMVELTIVLAIVSALLAIAAPLYREWIENTKIRTTAESVKSGLNIARAEAVRLNASVELQLAAGTSSNWTVACTAASATCPAVIQTRTRAEGGSTAITVAVANTAATDRIIRFNNLGRMIWPTPTAGTRININVDTTSLTAAQSRDLRVAVDVGGGVRLCDPSVVTAGDTRTCP
jgi:type IV fimbrial biogenesis protein FimT